MTLNGSGGDGGGPGGGSGGEKGHATRSGGYSVASCEAPPQTLMNPTAKLEGNAVLTLTAAKPGMMLPPTRHVRRPPYTSIWCATDAPVAAQLVR